MVLGMLFGGLAFVVAGFVQLKVQSAQKALDTGESKLAIYNTASFPVHYQLEGSDHFEISNKTLDIGEVSILHVCDSRYL